MWYLVLVRCEVKNSFEVGLGVLRLHLLFGDFIEQHWHNNGRDEDKDN